MYYKTKPTYVKAEKVDGSWRVVDAEDNVTLMSDEDFNDTYEVV